MKPLELDNVAWGHSREAGGLVVVAYPAEFHGNKSAWRNLKETAGGFPGLEPGYCSRASFGVCIQCGCEIIRYSLQHKLCSERCKRARHNARVAEWRKTQPSQAQPHVEKHCRHCNLSFTPKRKDARFCSSGCRVAAHRAAKNG